MAQYEPALDRGEGPRFAQDLDSDRQTTKLIISNKPRARGRPTSASPSHNKARRDQQHQSLGHSASARRVVDKDDENCAIAASPLKSRLAIVQERRVHGVLKDALALFQLASQETARIDSATSQLKLIIGNFALLVDKQQQKKHFQMQQQVQREEVLAASNGFVDHPELEFSTKLAQRVQLELETMIDTLRASHSVLENSNLRIKKALSSSRKQCGLFQKRIGTKYLNDLVANESSSAVAAARACSVRKHDPASGIGGGINQVVYLVPSNGGSTATLPLTRPAISTCCSSPLAGSKNRVPLSHLLVPAETKTNLVQPEFYESVMQRLGLSAKEQLDSTDVFEFVQEILIFCIAKNQSLTFPTKNFHRQSIQHYATTVVHMVQQSIHSFEMEPNTQANGSSASTRTPALVLSQAQFRGMLCDPPYVFDQLLQRVYVPESVESSYSNWHQMSFDQSPRNKKNGSELLHEIQCLTTAEQTLTMAKLLNDLADMDTNSHHKQMTFPHAKSTTFNRAFISTSKQITQQESKLLQKR